MSTFLFAVPTLKSHKASFFTSKCLRQDGRTWKSLNHFNNEHCLLNDATSLEKAVQVKYGGNWDDPEQKHELDTPMNASKEFMPSLDYQCWQKSTSSPNAYENLLSRSTLTKWLHAVLFKLALPAVRDTAAESMSPVQAPLNLSTFFRLMRRLHEIGYPKHWLSGILTDILLDKVVTSARPPNTSPLDIDEVRRERPPKRISILPFVHELSTLATIFRPCLPFPVLDPDLAVSSNIRRCTIDCGDMMFGPHGWHAQPDFILVFMSHIFMHRFSARAGGQGNVLREMLYEDRLLKFIPGNGEMVLTTWRWDPETDMASFWMREDVLHAMTMCPTDLAIWRTDNWQMEAGFVTLDAKNMTIGCRWSDRAEFIHPEMIEPLD